MPSSQAVMSCKLHISAAPFSNHPGSRYDARCRTTDETLSYLNVLSLVGRFARLGTYVVEVQFQAGFLRAFYGVLLYRGWAVVRCGQLDDVTGSAQCGHRNNRLWSDLDGGLAVNKQHGLARWVTAKTGWQWTPARTSHRLTRLLLLVCGLMTPVPVPFWFLPRQCVAC
jgi:hypothetical protein